MSVSTTNPKEKQLLPHSNDGDVCVGVKQAGNLPKLKAPTTCKPELVN